MATEKIGSIDWLRSSNGRLTRSARLALLRQVLLPGMAGVLRTLLRSGRRAPLELEQIPLPDSAAVRHAMQELEACAEPYVVQHSIRTYLWGAGFGRIGGLRHDPELLLVSCLLHDLGMTARHRDGSCQCFAGDSARAAAAVMRRGGWSGPQVETLADIICLHMNGHIAPADGVEAHLLQQGAACDVAGTRYYDFQAAYREAVLQKHPRHGLNRAFAGFMRQERSRYPASRAALMCDIGLPLMIRLNPYAE